MAAKRRRKTETTPGVTPPTEPTDNPEDSLPQDDAGDSKSLRPGPPIVGIGASAGGLDAFKKFFSAMPAESGIAFVLIPHLDPKHESLMVELLARQTRMQVLEVREGMAVEANHVYIIPPNKYMTIAEGVLHLTGPVERYTSQTSIDLFLRSLAADQLERAICIILSGTGVHGTLGFKAVKAAGGMAMVQDPATAEYPRMPQSAIATGMADYVLPPERMPDALTKYVQHFFASAGTLVSNDGQPGDPLNQVLTLLNSRTKFDFRCYRKKMLARRIERRMGLNHFQHLTDYLAHLRSHPEEIKQLVRDLFISVTSFFRDPEAFNVLETEVIAPLIQSKAPGMPLRIWVPGCATGEEAYSLAIVVLEQFAAMQKRCPLSVFATDVDADALGIARRGVYPESIAADVSPERLAAYFSPTDETLFEINKDVREALVVAEQNLITDAPFSKLDLIGCRNLLIYLEPEVQTKVVTLLHFALNEGGYLFLGPSETIGRQSDLFEPIDKKWRIFRRVGTTRPERVEFPAAARSDQRGLHLRRPETSQQRGVNLAELTQRLVLEQLGPAAVLVNRRHEVLYFLGPTSRYLDVPTGEPTRDLMKMARDGLRSKLRTAIQKALRDDEVVVASDVRVKRDGDYVPIAVTVKPVHAPKLAEGLVVVTFHDQGETLPAAPSSIPEDTLIRQLEYELRDTKEDLQITIEELEGSNEQLKVSNEEAMSMNEELQSANEELETSKEELQSLNEELTTVNNQLQDKVEELETASNDLANLLNCTGIAMVFLDTALCIRRFTPPTAGLFSLIPGDISRPLADISRKFTDEQLLSDAEAVLRDLTPREKDLQSDDGRWWFRRIVPYRTADNRIEGVAITFDDVTPLRHSTDALKRLNESLEKQVAERTAQLNEHRERLRAILDTAFSAIITADEHGNIELVNPAASTLFGYSADEMIGQNLLMLMPGPHGETDGDFLSSYQRSGIGRVLGTTREVTAHRKDRTSVPVLISVNEVPRLKVIVSVLMDISRQKELEREVVEIASLEQRRIGQDLHDTVGQELTALNMLAGDLVEALETEPSKSRPLADRISRGLRRMQDELRSVMRGIMPVTVDNEGLMAALTDLADGIQAEGKVNCTFDCPSPVAVADNVIATHLYLIAQEAVRNAVKHARADAISIALQSDGDLILSVQDDGDGMPVREAEKEGMGLRIMHNRAAIIGAKLTIDQAEPRGTLVTCVLNRPGR